jgi:hypothetical protein
LAAGILMAAPTLVPAADGNVADQTFAIQRLVLRKGPERLGVSLEVSGIIDSQMRETIESGLPWTLLFKLELYRSRRLLPDRRLHRWELRHTVRYDNLTGEFRVTREVTPDDASSQPRFPATVVKQFEEAKALVARVDDFPIDLSRDQKPLRYGLRVRAEVESVRETGFPILDRLFAGIPAVFPWQNETEWRVEEFEF